ncbi:hypothetical protein ACXDF8_20685 [Mycolicibacterium sp. CBM1]
MAARNATNEAAQGDIKPGRRRLLGVRTWLGAGALTVGVGAALAGAAGVAQADTTDHPSAGPSTSKHEAGPAAHSKRGAGTTTTSASAKRVNASPVTASGGSKTTVSSAAVSSSARVRAAAATSAAATASASTSTTKTIDTPLGPITVSIDATLPDPGTSGAVALALNASTPIGKAEISLAGTQTFTTTPSILNEIAITSGTLHLPAPAALLVSAAGSVVLGGLSAYNSAVSFATDLQSGDVLGAVQTFLAAGPKMANAVLFGHQSLTLPIDITGTGQVAQLSIPFGGLFAGLSPVSVTWPGYSYVDSGTGVQVKIDPVDVSFAGTEFGGAGPALLQLFGL